MPVIRPLPSLRGSVIAYSEQLDSWLGRSQDHRQFLNDTSKSDVPFHGNFYERLMQARSLAEQLRKTKSEMADRMLLQAGIAVLADNMARLKVTRHQYLDAQSMFPLPAAAELDAAKLTGRG